MTFKEAILKIFRFIGFHDSNRRRVRDVKAGEMICIEWDRAVGGQAKLTCINNDPKTKKILLQVWWNNHKELNLPEKQNIIFKYSDYNFKNFHLLNKFKIQSDNEEEESYISSLKGCIENRLKKEEYERISELKKRIKDVLLEQEQPKENT